MISNLKTVHYLLRPYGTAIVAILGAFLAAGFLEAMIIGSFFPMINGILTGSVEPATQSKVLVALGRLVKLLPFQDKVISAGALLVLLIGVSFAVAIFADTLATRYRLKAMVDYYVRVYEKLLRSHYLRFQDTKQGELVYIGTNAAGAVSELLLHFPRLAVESIQSLAIVILLVSISLRMTGALLLLLAAVALAFYTLLGRRIGNLAKAMNHESAALYTFFTESVGGVKQIKTSSALEFFIERYSEIAKRLERLHFQNISISNLTARVIRFAGMSLVFLTILVLKIFFPDQFTSTLPVLAVYMVALHRLIPSVSTISSEWLSLRALMPRLHTVHEILTDTRYDKRTHGAVLNEIRSAIAFKNVSFSYPTKKEVLKSVSFDVPRNRTVAIVGHSGSGKSTIAELFVRLYEPESGQVLVDGRDYLEFSLSSWLARVSFVSQDCFLFNATVMDNIRLARPAATVEQVREAARKAHADEFIERLDQGYETLLGDRGVKLSGGQRQRIAIARAFLGTPDVLVLDEATSALDNISEGAIQTAVSDGAEARSTLIIAHRLSTIQHADEIIVLDSGSIVERGTHKDLLAKQGFYFALYTAQQTGDRQQDPPS